MNSCLRKIWWNLKNNDIRRYFVFWGYRVSTLTNNSKNYKILYSTYFSFPLFKEGGWKPGDFYIFKIKILSLRQLLYKGAKLFPLLKEAPDKSGEFFHTIYLKILHRFAVPLLSLKEDNIFKKLPLARREISGNLCII